MLKRTIPSLMALTLLGCGTNQNSSHDNTASSSRVDAVTAAPTHEVTGSEAESLRIKMNAPKYVITVSDSAGNIITSRTTNDENLTNNIETLVKSELKVKSRVLPLNKDDTSHEGSTDSWWGWGGWRGWGFGYPYYHSYGYGFGYPYSWGGYWGGYYYNRWGFGGCYW